MRMKKQILILAMAAVVAAAASDGYAQCAGCGADYNKADREAAARLVERQRLEKIDPPIQKDPLGDAIIGGGVTGIVRGSVGAAARAIVTGTAAGAAMQKAREASRK
jgi:hypothetical protein